MTFEDLRQDAELLRQALQTTAMLAKIQDTGKDVTDVCNETAAFLTKMLDDMPQPTGFDVWMASDAPSFAKWERVAASVKDENFVSELVHGSEDWASAVRWSNELTQAELFSEQYPRIHRHPILRKYIVLPAGSPPPESDAS